MKLFYDDEHEALRRVIENGKGYKATAIYLWPAMKPESAYARLKVSVKEGGDQHLRFGEVIRIMTFNDCYDALYFACDECSHDRPPRRASTDMQAELMREFNRRVEELGRIQQQLQATGLPTLPALKAAP